MVHVDIQIYFTGSAQTGMQTHAKVIAGGQGSSGGEKYFDEGRKGNILHSSYTANVTPNPNLRLHLN